MNPQHEAVREELEAAAQLRAEGIFWADAIQIRDRVERNREARRRQAEGEAGQAAARTDQVEPPAVMIHEAPSPTAKPKRRRGRPPKDQLWMYEAAELFAQGLTLRRAARRVGVSLSESELRNVYR